MEFLRTTALLQSQRFNAVEEVLIAAWLETKQNKFGSCNEPISHSQAVESCEVLQSVRQSVAQRRALGGMETGKSQSGCTGRGLRNHRRHCVAWRRRGDSQSIAGTTTGQELSLSTGAKSRYPETQGRYSATRNRDGSRSRSANCHEAGAGTYL